jgi:pyochelin biosynthesis protein PchC
VARSMRGSATVLAVQYPGRQDRRAEEPIGNIAMLADHIHKALRPHPAQRLVFFGHSMGAVVAYEVARRMARRDDTAPARLVVSGRRAPTRHRVEGLHLRDDAGIVAELKGLSGTDLSLLEDEEVRTMILPAVRSDYRAIETYVHTPGPPLTCPITAFVGDRDPYATVEEVRDWGARTAGAFDLEVFEGGHFYLTSRPSEVIARLTALLP